MVALIPNAIIFVNMANHAPSVETLSIAKQSVVMESVLDHNQI